MTWLVCVDAYSLEAGDVGKYLTPVARFPHRTGSAAFRRLGSCIGGKLRHQFAGPGARKFYVVAPDGERFTWSELRERLCLVPLL